MAPIEEGSTRPISVLMILQHCEPYRMRELLLRPIFVNRRQTAECIACFINHCVLAPLSELMMLPRSVKLSTVYIFSPFIVRGVGGVVLMTLPAFY